MSDLMEIPEDLLPSAEETATPATPVPPPLEDQDQQMTTEKGEAKKDNTKKEKLYNCCLCYERFPREKLVNACKTSSLDLWCGECLERAFVNASKGPDCMPAKCHNIIPLHFAMPFISEEIGAAYRSQFDVWSTKERTYCPIPSCSAFIAPRLIDAAMDKTSATFGALNCPQCQASLCVECRSASHPGESCPQDDVDPETLAALKRWGYKRCPKCREAVRRMWGCRHMRCICGASWCWICMQPIDECLQYDCDEEIDDEDNREEEENEESASYEQLWEDMLEEGIELPTLFNEDYGGETPPVPDTAAPVPEPRARLRRRRSNLDALPGDVWQRRGFDFGDEPINNSADHVWCCSHNFKPASKESLEHEAKEMVSDKFYCHRCWSVCDIEAVKECERCCLMACAKCVDRMKCE